MNLLEEGQVVSEHIVMEPIPVKGGQPTKADKLEMDELRREVRQALVELKTTQNFFDLACGGEEVEYAIYAVLAAERKYGMLINKAKDKQLNWSYYTGVAR